MEQLLNKGHSWKGLVLENLEIVSSVIRRQPPSPVALLSVAAAPQELPACKRPRGALGKVSSAGMTGRTAKCRML